MIGQLYYYFGSVGLASIVAWAAALAMLVLSARHPRRQYRYLAALGIAALALVLANINSRAVSAIATDRTEELQAGRARQQQARAAETATTGPRFAEDPAPADNPAVPAYRLAGKQQRESGKKQPLIANDLEPAAATKAAGRVMKEADVVRANRLDRYNLLAARSTLGLVLLLVLVDYVARFNRTFESWWPLPIGGKWLDALSHKSHSVFLVSPPERFCRELLERVVRRGETFIYCGASDPCAAATLPRLAIGRKALTELATLVQTDDNFDAEFVLESAWFGRYGVVVTHPGAVRRLWRELLPYLRIRQLTRAAAPHTVNLLWNLPTSPPEAVLRELLALTRETNFRLIISSPQPPPPELAAKFEEVR